jgi:arginine deiminase
MRSLRRVLVHRPGRDLDRLLPDNFQQLFFDEVLWRAAAQREHDSFVTLLSRYGIEACYLDDLVTWSLHSATVRHDVIEAELDPVEFGEKLIAG